MDIVDNSVENSADAIAVFFLTHEKLIESIVIADNGSGISVDVIDEVLRAGSRTRHLYRDQSLSRFGIGLKGAGFALARRITVLTQTEDGPLFRRSIDRDDIEETDDWNQETREPNEAEAARFKAHLDSLPGQGQRKSGTVVLLEKILVNTRDLARLRSDLVRSAGETYSKYLNAGSGVSRLSIRVDGVDVEPLDPLHRDNPGTVTLMKRQQVAFDDGSVAYLTAVALPHPSTQPDEVVRKYRYMQKYQGVYVYRNQRLVMGGQTLDLFGRDFHLNAFRVELEYSTQADKHIQVDVAKSSVVLSEEAAAKVKPFVTNAARTADTLWRDRDVLTEEDIKGLFDESNRQIGSRYNLLVKMARSKRKDGVAGAEPSSAKPSAPPASPPAKKRKAFEAGYLKPVDTLPDGLMYRPIHAGDSGVIVEVNLAHPFSKAVFEVEKGEGKKSVPRRATTAIQQLLYVLGYCEYSMTEEEQEQRLFEQFRQFVTLNLRALLAE